MELILQNGATTITRAQRYLRIPMQKEFLDLKNGEILKDRKLSEH